MKPVLFLRGLDHNSATPRTICDCSQDQWDIYMLDPAYTCVYKRRPEISMIMPNLNHTKSTPSEPSTSKRTLSPVSPDGDDLPPHSRKKRRTDPKDEEDEVEQLLSSEIPKWRPKPSQRARSKSAQPAGGKPATTIDTQPPLEPIRELQDTDMEDLESIRTPANSQPTTAEKRKGALSPLTSASHSHSYPENLGADEVCSPSTFRPSKRVRTEPLAPDRPRYRSKMREERGRQRTQRKAEWNHKTRKAREDAFIQGLFNTGPARFQPPSQSEPEIVSDDSSDGVEEGDPIEAEKRKIEESRRKIAELERDKPLWETAQRERERAEREEERERQAAKRARDRRAEAERKEREYRERMTKEAEERQKRDQEECQRREKERKHTQNRTRWARGPWTIQRALERYRFLCEQFDSAKFSSEDPLTFDDIPWPMVHCSFSAEDIEWSTVENFFASVKPHMRAQDYKVFVEKSHRRQVLLCPIDIRVLTGCRFHPDRWRARGLLKNMQDDDERGFIEVAANTVAQALTPLWREVKGS